MKTQHQKRNAILAALFILVTLLKAQDRIVLNNGLEIFGRVISITNYEIKYKEQNAADGPLNLIPKTDVFMIQYGDGSKEIYGGSLPATKNPNDTDHFVPLKSRIFSGPRFGVTYISPGTLTDQLSSRGKQPVITQFGWQFEARLFTIQNGTSGIVEFVPFIGGMEQGVFLPSANLLIGLRSGAKHAFEFACGPNVSVSGLGMVFAVGTNFNSGNINFPVNLAFVPSVSSKKTSYDPATNITSSSIVRTGFRICLTVGFNMRRK